MTTNLKHYSGEAAPATTPAGVRPSSGAASHDVLDSSGFFPTLPPSNAAAPEDGRTPHSHTTPLPVPTILVVDDNPTNLKLASDVLEFAGYRVLKAVDAEEAQVVLCHFQPNLIFMDLALPGMDGLTLTRKLKAAPSTQHIRIVALTAFAMKGDDQKAREAGCDGYISKPIDTRIFPAQAAEFLQGRSNLTTVPLG